MRLSTQQFFQLGSSSISDLNRQTAKLQEQISTGRRVLNPADDPASASRIVRLESQLNSAEQYRKNVDFAESRLERSEQAIASIESVVDRVRELVIQAGNGALDNSQRYSIAVEIEQRVEELAALANSTDELGESIFGGFQTQVDAYAKGQGGQFIFQGNGGVRRVQIDNESYVAIAETGLEVFENITVVNSQVETTVGSSNSVGFQLLSTTIEDRQLADAQFPTDYSIQFQPESAVVPNGPNYSVTRLSDGVQVATNAVYDEALGITFDGIALTGVGGPPQSGDSFSVMPVTSTNLLNTVDGIAKEVATFADPEQRNAFIAASLQNIDAIQDKLLESRARIGVNLNRLESAKDTLADRELSQQSLLSDIRDLDYAEAISNLSLLTFVLEASQASFVRVSNLSLFNYIR